MNQSVIPILTLRQIIDLHDVSLSFDEIFVLDNDNIENIQINYPSKAMCFGLILITKGSALIGVDFQNIELKERDALFLFPSNIFEFKSVSEDCKLQGVLCSIDLFSELNLKMSSQEVLDAFSNNFSKVLSLTQDIFETVSTHIKTIKNLNSPDISNIFKIEMLKLYYSLIMYEMINYNTSRKTYDNIATFRKEDIALQFVSLIAVNFTLHKDVQYYADQLLITRTHLTRTIKDVLGKTPKQIIEAKIIAEAKVLLLKNELSITQVMAEINFEDQAAFSKFFKKNTGISPNMYRKQILN